ncbi:MAG: enoyl-CoA hydratase-related protein [Alphaproteobacteria bacterium]|jgi:2-(1,2-epoxy-1,2-dihydrophenyl)acetyl-CoA isomerase|nr:enoyl-CoA hydratase-related protein [Alphaproteobacteria bacterium]MDP6623083.1 enoyl-CoA hydratase-related protein [Alphaproteobacteria bacterium]
MSETLLIDKTDGVATLTLNRPERLNTIDFEMLEALIAALDDMAADDDVRCLVLTGSGDTFCAGADIGRGDQSASRGRLEWQDIVERYLHPVRQIAALWKPVITVCKGNVFGGGLGLAMASDLRIASDDSRYSAPFIKLALTGCDMSTGYFLPRLVGLGRATEMMMTGRVMKAEEAGQSGLVTEVVPRAELDQRVADLARGFADGPPRALAMTKQGIRRSLDRDMAAEFDYELYSQVQLLQGDDFQEGVAAFFEKRPPRFTGR